MNMKNSHRYLFLSASVFNFAAAVTLLFAYKPVFSLIGLTPLPENPIYLHLFALLAASFGLAYYWVSKDFDRNRNLVQLGVITKIAVFAMPLAYFIAGSISWQLPVITSVDLVYAILFASTLRQNPSYKG